MNDSESKKNIMINYILNVQTSNQLGRFAIPVCREDEVGKFDETN